MFRKMKKNNKFSSTPQSSLYRLGLEKRDEPKFPDFLDFVMKFWWHPVSALSQSHALRHISPNFAHGSKIIVQRTKSPVHKKTIHVFSDSDITFR